MLRNLMAALRPSKRRAFTMADRVEITIPPVDDFHHHFRDGEVLKDTVQHACRMFKRAVRRFRRMWLLSAYAVMADR